MGIEKVSGVNHLKLSRYPKDDGGDASTSTRMELWPVGSSDDHHRNRPRQEDNPLSLGHPVGSSDVSRALQREPSFQFSGDIFI
jgi:hypothetical protein